ncbi:MAG: metallophosphoesterase [Bacteroides sp.]|nr:metallophosphoesterase [Bacteroides sp.]
MNTTVIISDIHGNFDALTAVLQDMKKYAPDRIVCLGDVIGYGAEPCACLDKLHGMDNIDLIMGNHEAMWLGKITSANCSTIGQVSAKWNDQNIPRVYESSMNKYSLQITRGRITFCHTASLGKDHNYPYLNLIEQVLEGFSSYDSSVVFYGHTHRARITEVSENNSVFDTFVKETIRLELKESSKYYINVGSVGQQRDTITDCSYAVLWEDGNNRSVQINRIDYDSYSAYVKVRNSVHSEEIASYLIRENERRRRYEDAYNRV